jgi:membrane protease YdiL (CAAX protease family)
VTFIALALLQTAVRSRFQHPLRETTEAFGLVVILIGAVFLSSRVFDRRPIREFGLSLDAGWWRSFAVGGVVALLVNAGALLVALGAGWATVAGVTQGSGALSFLPAMLLVFVYIGAAATWEEFVFRGTMLKNLAEGANGYVQENVAVGLAVVFNCVVFAFLHGGKVAHVSQYGYYLLAGLVLGGVYVLTGELALPMGFHVFYNYTQSAVFGFGVSQTTPELIALNLVGSARYVGEEGLVHVGAAAVGGLLLMGYVYWQKAELRIHRRVTQWTSTA